MTLSSFLSSRRTTLALSIINLLLGVFNFLRGLRSNAADPSLQLGVGLFLMLYASFAFWWYLRRVRDDN